ncbi:hypothetical protein [Prauserella endophytica]|uniref:Uncharacterized protein n=1 Tax=Prauserella endophytica TaxID=1592324 RepID=A0ABY2S0A3_9PSEU|nr:hypothetical protein [Prauserella endophytica]TKG67048.1 hypothetical protein FCN18_24390 [Prauserella endophytica]
MSTTQELRGRMNYLYEHDGKSETYLTNALDAVLHYADQLDELALSPHFGPEVQHQFKQTASNIRHKIDRELPGVSE